MPVEGKEEPVGIGRENLQTLIQGLTPVGERGRKAGLIGRVSGHDTVLRKFVQAIGEAGSQSQPFKDCPICHSLGLYLYRHRGRNTVLDPEEWQWGMSVHGAPPPHQQCIDFQGPHRW